MGIRSREQLRRDQDALLAAYRGRFVGADSTTTLNEADAAGVTTIGKVTDVVTSDATYGPHLVVQPQVFEEIPPTASAANRPAVRAYPTPNHVVTDYAVNEFAILATARGALLAVKVG